MNRPLGIYYLTFAKAAFPRSARKLIIGYTRDDMLAKIAEKEIPADFMCWFDECRTPKTLVAGNIAEVSEWITKHMPTYFGEKLVD